MCKRVRLEVNDSARDVNVVFMHSVATIQIPESIDAVTLRKRIERIVDYDQCECETKLWADDSFPRFFEITANGLVISCIPHS